MTAPRRRPAIALACTLVLLASWARAQSQSHFDYNGIVHVSWWINEYNNFDQPTGQGTDSRAALAATGANWAALLVTWYQNDAAGSITSPNQPGIIFRRPAPHIQNEEPKTPSDDALRFAIRELHGRGVKVMLKPHVDAVNGQWRGDFNPSNVNGWFASYTQFIVHYAQMAEDEGVEAFVMGTEFKTISGAANRDRWIAVISAVRAVYGGVLTYAANATFPGDEFTSVSFWDQLDVLGLDAYFNLTNLNNPTVAQLVSAWTSNRFGENAVANVQNFASSRGKPVIFTEIGYKSTDRANVEPWNFGLSGPVDTGEQRDCYEAAFTVWSQQTSFMKGIFWWAWPVPPPPANDGDYNPRGKPAEQVLRTWQGPDGPSFTLSASPTSVTVNRGGSGTVSVGIARTSFTGSVVLSASGLPSGVTASFSPASTTGTSSTLTLTASSTAAAGPATVTVTGVGGGVTRTTAIGLTVNAPDFSLSPPCTLTVARGGSGACSITVTRTGGFTGSVAFAIAGLPSGVTASFNPTSTTGNTTTLTVNVGTTAPLGSSSPTVSGTGGGLTRTLPVSLTITEGQTPNFVLSASPSSLTLNRGASGASAIGIARTGGFTGSVAFSIAGLPSGVTATFNPPSTTGTASTLNLSASATATLGNATLTITGTGTINAASVTRTTTLALTVNDGGSGGVTVTPLVTTSSPWFNEQQIRVSNPGTLTALSITIVVQRTTGISFSGQYNTVGGQIGQSNSSSTSAVTYQFSLVPGQTLGQGTSRIFAAQTSGTGTIHATAGDTYTVTYTTGGVAYTQSGHF